MKRFFKRYWLLLLFGVFLIQAGFFAYWIMDKGGIETILVPEPLVSFDLFNSYIDDVNETFGAQMSNAPALLLQELQNSRMYLMLHNKEDSVFIQTVTLAGGKIQEVPESDDHDIFYSFAPDESKATFFALPDERETIPGGWDAQAQLFVIDTSKLTDGIASLADAEAVDSTPILNKRTPSISDSGAVLFNGWEILRDINGQTADEWSIYAVENGTAVFVTEGYLPKWINDTSFLFLKNDGLYERTIDGTEVLRIGASPNETFRNNNRFDISSDGNVLALTKPDSNLIEVYKWNGQSWQKEHAFETRSGGVLLSPSGTFLASQGIVGTDINADSALEFFDLSSYTKLSFVIPLQNFLQSHTFMNDWVSQ